jgi:hypothetical protein
MSTDETSGAFEEVFPKHGQAMVYGETLEDFALRVWGRAYQTATAAAEEKYLGVIRELAILVRTGLNLCAQSRNLEKTYAEAPNEHCLTPYMWAQDSYEKSLEEWESEASKSLALAEPLLKEDK